MEKKEKRIAERLLCSGCKNRMRRCFLIKSMCKQFRELKAAVNATPEFAWSDIRQLIICLRIERENENEKSIM